MVIHGGSHLPLKTPSPVFEGHWVSTYLFWDFKARLPYRDALTMTTRVTAPLQPAASAIFHQGLWSSIGSSMRGLSYCLSCTQLDLSQLGCVTLLHGSCRSHVMVSALDASTAAA